MDSPSRVKMKIGEHEIEAEGSPDMVREQFQAWQELVKLAYATPIPQVVPVAQTAENLSAGLPTKSDALPSNVDAELTKIMRIDNRAISLTARTTNVHDAMLIMLYGQKILRNNDSVTGAELISGLNSTGGFAVDRLDRVLNKLSVDGDVMTFGERRGKKYRLTNSGTAKARAIASDLIAMVA
jgi:hypothetical protein